MKFWANKNSENEISGKGDFGQLRTRVNGFGQMKIETMEIGQMRKRACGTWVTRGLK